MNALFWVMGAAMVASFVFWTLVIVGAYGAWKRRGGIRYRGFRRASLRAAQRFVLGEIDADTYRRLREDLAGVRR